MKKLAFALATAAFASSAHAYSLGPFDDLLVFGDSFSDPGNVFEDLLGGVEDVPGFPISDDDIYPNNQWSSGESWAVKMGATYQPLASGLRKNYAYGGARAGSDDPDTLDLFEQVATYVTPTNLGTNPIATIFIGGNDFLNFTPPAGSFNPDGSLTPTGLAAVGGLFNAMIGGVSSAITTLAATGLDDFLVIGLPDIGKRPNSPAPGIESLLSAQYNAALFEAMKMLDKALGPVDIYTLDIATILAPIFTDAGGFSNFEDACLLSTPCIPSEFVFYDPIHPTDHVHGLIAGAVNDRLEAIPLPAGAYLLLAGLGALGVASRRRVAARTH